LAIDNDDLEESGDLASKLKGVLSDIENIVSRTNDQFAGGQRNLTNMNAVLEEVLATSEDLSRSFVKARDLESAMIKNSRIFEKVQREAYKFLDHQNKQRIADIKRVAELEGKSGEDLKFDLLQQQQFHRNLVEIVENELKLTKKKADLALLESIRIGNIKDAVEDLGNKIRNPDKLFSSMLGTAGQLPSKVFDAAKGSKNLGETLSKLTVPALDKMGGFAKVLFSASGFLIAGVALATAALVGLYALFKNFWEFMDKKVMPAQASFNKEIGSSSENSARLKNEMTATGVQFELLGKSFEEGAQFSTDFTKALMSTSAASKEAQQLGKELALVVGLTAEESGNLIMQFQKQGNSLADVRDMFGEAEKGAKAYGLPVNDVLRDLGKYPNILARFGTSNRKEFAKSAVIAKSYGLDIGKINEAFGKQLDTFEGSADASAKLNAIFGTTINSFELMLETNPEKRMEMLRKQLIAQGKEWNKLSVFERNVITQTLGVDEATASLVLSSDEERKKLERKANQKKKEIRINEEWNKSLTTIKSTLMAWGVELDRVMRAVTGLISTIFGWDTPGKNMQELASSLVKTFQDLTTWLNNTNENWSNWKGLDGYGKALKVIVETVQNLYKAFKLLSGITIFQALWDFGKALYSGASFGEALSSASARIQGDVPFLNELTGSSSMPAPPAQIKNTSTPTATPLTSGGGSSTASTRSAGGASTGNIIKIELAAVYLDGKKIGEAQVKYSRQ